MKRLDSESWKVLGAVTMLGFMALCGLVLKEKISVDTFMILGFVLFPLSCFCFLVGYISEATEETSRQPLRKISLAELSQNSKFMKQVRAEREAEAVKHAAAAKRAAIHQNPTPKTRRK